MPGSIQVSVLDFKELPSSSNSVKVSLGKVEHEAGDKGTFSFPLTNLRDNLVITLEDSEGNQVSSSGIRITSIVEKGTWDDSFPIEGGGLIHMKLQFVLSDEERNRIRLMREAAMKKKEAEIVGSRLRNAKSSLEVSDVLRAQDFQTVKASKSSDGIKQESFQSQSFTNAVDKEEETQGIEQNTTAEDTKNQASSPTDISEKNEPNSSGNSVDKLNEQKLQEKNQSNVSKENSSSPLLQETDVNSNKNKEILLQQAKLPDRQNLELPEKHNPEVPEKQNFEIPNKQNLELPEKQNLELPEKQNLELPEKQNLEVLDKKNLKISDNQNLELPEKQNLEVLDKKNLKISDNQNLEIPDKKNLEMPQKQNLEIPDKQNLEEKVPSYVKKMSKLLPLSQETEVNTIKNNEIELHQPKRLQDSSSRNVESTIAEKIKSFSPKLTSELDKTGSLEKTPRNIKKMISVFETSVSQDSVPLKPLGTKSYRFGSSHLLKDNLVNDKSKLSSTTRLRNSFSTGDLRKNLSNIITKEEVEQVDFDNNFVDSSETNLKSKNNDPKETENLPKDSYTEEKTKSREEEDATVSGRIPADTEKDSDYGIKNNIEYFHHDGYGPLIFVDEKRHYFCVTAHGDRAMSLLDDCKIEEKGHQEKIAASKNEIGESDCGSDVIMKQGEEMVGISNPKSEDEEASNGSLGQAIKIALVVGFGILVLLFRQREPTGKSKKRENSKNQVFMNKREDQRRKRLVL